MNQAANTKRQAIITALAGLIIIVIIVAAVLASPKKSSSAVSKTITPASTSTPSTTTVDSGSSSYKDGNYTATGSYQSPGGVEKLTISVTLKKGLITSTSAVSGSTSGTSAVYQSDFIDSYKSLIVGKSIASLKLGRISGSSLTSLGFNDAISQIKTEAQA